MQDRQSDETIIGPETYDGGWVALSEMMFWCIGYAILNKHFFYYFGITLSMYKRQAPNVSSQLRIFWLYRLQSYITAVSYNTYTNTWSPSTTFTFIGSYISSRISGFLGPQAPSVEGKGPQFLNLNNSRITLLQSREAPKIKIYKMSHYVCTFLPHDFVCSQSMCVT